MVAVPSARDGDRGELTACGWSRSDLDVAAHTDAQLANVATLPALLLLGPELGVPR